MPDPEAPPVFDSLDAPALRADAYVLDVWGVLWDGIRAYPEAVSCLDRMRRLEKRVLLLSNAPRRSESVTRGLAGIGIGNHLFDGILTSGDLCRAACADGADGLGRAYHYLGLEKDRGLLDGLRYREASGPGDADFVLNLGTRRLGDRAGAYRSELRRAADRGLPMLCANPDRVIVRADGTLIDCAGALADLYAELGGTVRSFGKPLGPTYQACIGRLRGMNPGLEESDMLAVGDSLPTDIRGARDAGLRTALVAGGIHGADLAIRSHGDRPSPERVADLVRRTGVRPDAVLAAFRWEAP